MKFVFDYLQNYLTNIRRGKMTTALSVFCIVGAGADLFFQRQITERAVELLGLALFLGGLPDVPSKKKEENKTDQPQNEQ